MFVAIVGAGNALSSSVSTAAPINNGLEGQGKYDWTDYKNSVGAGAKYTSVDGGGNTGKYSFTQQMATSLESYKKAPDSCKEMGRRNSGLAREACGGTQESMMDEFSMRNLKFFKTNCSATQRAVDSGMTVTGLKGKTCKVTWSGLLAGAHAVGVGGVCSVFKGGKDRDDGRISIKDVICTSVGKKVPKVSFP